MTQTTLGALKNPRTLIGAAITAMVFLLTCVWFHASDVCNSHFSTHGPIYAVYQLLKLLSAVYFIWIIYFAGHFILETLRTRGWDFELTALDRTIVTFYVGASAIAIAVCAAGYLHLYYAGVAIACMTLLVLISYPHFAVTIKELWRFFSRARPRLSSLVDLLFPTIATLLLLTILLNKVIFPTGNGDALTHYTEYFKVTIRSHGTQPNNVWYHYYYSKGAALVFLNMLLVDDTAASLPTFYMLIAAAAVLFSLGLKITASREWAWTIVIAYLRVIPFDVRVTLEKQHLFMTSLIVGVMFMLILLPGIAPRKRLVWTAFTALLIVHLVIFAPTAAAFITPFLLIYAGIYYFLKQKDFWRWYGLLTIVVICTALAVCAINYFVTGMPEINPARLMWALANQRRFSHWTSPYMMVYLLEGSNPTVGTFTLAKDISLAGWFRELFHLHWFEFLFPNLLVVCVVIFLALVTLGSAPQRKRVLPFITPLIVLLVSAGAVSLLFNQPESMFRYFDFTTPLLFLLAIVAWDMTLEAAMTNRLAKTGVALVIVGAALHDMAPDRYTRNQIIELVRNETSFALGRGSFKDAFAKRGVLWPELVTGKHLLGMDQRMLSLNLVEAIGAVPGQPVESEVNYNYREWHQMVFAPPAAAKAACMREGLNYFIFDTQKRFAGAFPYSPLFAPQNINEYLGVIYSEGTTYLLTWKEQAVEPIPPAAVAALRATELPHVGSLELYLRVKSYYDANKGAPFPVRSDPHLPPVAGWQ